MRRSAAPAEITAGYIIASVLRNSIYKQICGVAQETESCETAKYQ